MGGCAVVDTATDSLVLIHLDFTPALPCEALNHQGSLPAQWQEDGKCPACNTKVQLLTCALCKLYAQSCRTIVHTTGCGTTSMRESWGIIWTPIKEVM